MTAPTDIPTAGDLRKIRELLGLSQTELGSVLGFGEKGVRVVRNWEQRETFRPTPLAWAAIRYLVMFMDLYAELPDGPLREKNRNLLPECLR